MIFRQQISDVAPAEVPVNLIQCDHFSGIVFQYAHGNLDLVAVFLARTLLGFHVNLHPVQQISLVLTESEAGAKTGYVDKALSADKLKTARAVTLAGAITGNTTFDGSKDISIETSLKPLEEQDIPELSLSKIKDAGTAAACNTGTEAGQIPVIGEGGKLNEALIPQQTLTTDNVNEGKKNLYYTNERVTNYLQDTANTFVMDGGNA